MRAIAAEEEEKAQFKAADVFSFLPMEIHMGVKLNGNACV